MKRAAIAALALCAGLCHAEGFIADMIGKPAMAGVHTLTRHDPSHGANDFNPGAYVITDTGATLGAYYNSHRNLTAYAGWTTPEWYRFKATAGVATGYHAPLTVVVVPSLRLFTLDNGMNVRLVGGPKLDENGQSILHVLLDWELK